MELVGFFQKQGKEKGLLNFQQSPLSRLPVSIGGRNPNTVRQSLSDGRIWWVEDSAQPHEPKPEWQKTILRTFSFLVM